jgi:urease accessory protein
MAVIEALSSLVVAPAANGGSVVRKLRGAAPFGLRELRGSGDGCSPRRVAIVQTAACLVGGDVIRLHVCVENGAALELLDISATLVHPGAAARQLIDLEVGENARLVFAEQPLIIAAGAQLERRLTLTLGAGAQVVHRDTLVLGRHGEQPGNAFVRSRVQRGTTPVLDETVHTGDLASLRSAAMLGDARAIGTLGRYGVNGPTPDGAFKLGADDTFVRQLAPRTRDLHRLDVLQSAWTTAMQSPCRRG